MMCWLLISSLMALVLQVSASGASCLCPTDFTYGGDGCDCGGCFWQDIETLPAVRIDDAKDQCTVVGAHLPIIEDLDCLLVFESYLAELLGDTSEKFHTCGVVESVDGSDVTVTWDCPGKCDDVPESSVLNMEEIPTHGNPRPGRCLILHYIPSGGTQSNLTLLFSPCVQKREVLCQAGCLAPPQCTCPNSAYEYIGAECDTNSNCGGCFWQDIENNSPLSQSAANALCQQVGAHLAVINDVDCWFSLQNYLQGGGGAGSMPMFDRSVTFHTCGKVESVSGSLITIRWDCAGVCEDAPATTTLDTNIIPMRGHVQPGRCVDILYLQQGLPAPIDPNTISDTIFLKFTSCNSRKQILCQAECVFFS